MVIKFLLPEFYCRKSIKSLVQGILPGIALKIFLVLLPIILMIMSKIEGFTSLSSLDRRSASKYHLFLLVSVFIGSIATGVALGQLKTLLNQSPTEYVLQCNWSFRNMVLGIIQRSVRCTMFSTAYD